jgi:hypothetical protein
LLLFVPGPTLPWLEGLAAFPLSDFMFAPVVEEEFMEEWCLVCFCDFASAARGETTSPATASAPIDSLAFIMRIASFGTVMPGETFKRGEEFRRAVGILNDRGADEFQPKTAFSLRSGKLIENAWSSLGSRAMSNLLFLRRSYAYRHAAVEMMRKARTLPPGSERRATRQLARALKDLAKNEAWLEGQVTKRLPVPLRAVRA